MISEIEDKLAERREIEEKRKVKYITVRLLSVLRLHLQIGPPIVPRSFELHPQDRNTAQHWRIVYHSRQERRRFSGCVDEARRRNFQFSGTSSEWIQSIELLRVQGEIISIREKYGNGNEILNLSEKKHNLEIISVFISSIFGISVGSLLEGAFSYSYSENSIHRK